MNNLIEYFVIASSVVLFAYILKELALFILQSKIKKMIDGLDSEKLKEFNKWYEKSDIKKTVNERMKK